MEQALKWSLYILLRVPFLLFVFTQIFALRSWFCASGGGNKTIWFRVEKYEKTRQLRWTGIGLV